jgi:transcription termination factor NusB
VTVKDIPYYKPTQEEIVTYFQSSYDDRSPAANAMLEFLARYKLNKGEDVEDLMAEISDVCVAEEDMQEVLDLLDEYGLLFKGLDELTHFTQLFNELSNHSRKWTLRGHTPLAIENQKMKR